MASLPEPDDAIRRSDGLAYMTADSPSPYLIESEIAMLGRLGRGGTPRARLMGRIAAIFLLATMSLGILAQLMVVFSSR
ncbi:hypothetical protein [Allorhizocola rhizosphaerae]|uniref:hypothetical protein n=1 Tax=Allorhizocola rhizosphaerae TaxID=1872709 RepID=UPI000E3E567C|nr:hypothetical protein [Allorhizocola rhizosphaerae]